ncbi:dienelactone hydrolase family protein [Pseudoduganella umbonata]|uniref:Carboxymethylenebutenolidase n=1 Tax=Pseudoduganella umbonata TaxID=864828 RepID=A0A4P8HM60_9BURK|nr:dienelactone hydrolase family protein [Pseudoduganella umbonata]MBB3225164.1 carboxymethylenebutenolidase [Pseudoduganella umbonata]QCP09305.1 dienelactone hydrolase family protein [Pseudoduganella umbonata]
MDSETVQVAVQDGVFDCLLVRPAAPGPAPVIAVLQEIFGVNPGIRSIAAHYAEAGYLALCPDLFWRSERHLSMSETDPAHAERGFALYNAYDFDRGVDDIAAAIALARTLPGSSGKVGVTGYCLGGLLTFLAARTDGDAFAAYYGGGTERFVDRAAGIRAPLLYHLAEEDEYIGRDAQLAIRAALAAVPSATVHSYPGCNHAFARPGGSHYDAASATLANDRTDRFFAQTLR